ncbi:DUF305 domain-containing protein [Pseudonocardia nigra]|uniref:DUF305 domain-containing protein n=1 Tax=Pseudonocardia nigra TaxID=1921578 RepID=UPI001C5E6BA0|nr:DUF305 domain-containing protein [Pseudonocardia nigra]
MNVRRIAGATGAALASLALVACGGGTTAGSPAGSAAPTSAAPTSAAPTSATATAGQPFTDADVRFAQTMIPHHRQAIEMAELALDRSGNPEVRALAEQIRAAQGPLTGLLNDWGAPVPAGDGMDHDGMHHDGMSGMSGMSGMMSPEQMEQLRAADGAAFDRMFLEMMIAHHEGAVTDARRELAEGADERAKALASEIVATQTAEIDRMRQLLQAI